MNYISTEILHNGGIFIYWLLNCEPIRLKLLKAQ